MQVKLHEKQLEVATDQHRFRTICAGRRWGKSVLSRLIVLKWALERAGPYWIVSPTYRQGKQNHWLNLKREITQLNPKWIAKTNEVDLSITLVNGSSIELKGAENPDTLRGTKIRGLVVDEIASIRNWDWLWEEVLQGNTADYQAPAIFISTPKGYNHFYDLFKLGDTGDGDYKSWRFKSTDNPYFPAAEFERLKNELTEDTFAQEYLADFRKHTGLVYKEFERDIHVIEPFDIPDSWDIYRGIDFGSTNPTACLWIAVDRDDNWFVVSEHYATGQTIDYHAGVINAHPLSRRVSSSFGDPSGAQWIAEFNQKGVYITAATKETNTAFNTWVRFGIDKVGQKLKPVPGRTSPLPRHHGTRQVLEVPVPSLFVFSSCVQTIREFETYRWKEKSVTQAQDLNEPDVPEKANDHAMDALRYFAVSYRKVERYQERPDDISKKNWSLI